MAQQRVRIALDAMGGDHGPAETVPGAVQAARAAGVEVLLVGDPAAVEAELVKQDTAGLALTTVPAEGVISDHEHPALGLRQKPRASVVVATQLVKQGKADAIVSMGSTGATMAATTLLLGTLGGLDRPALGGPFLGLAPRTTVLDLGSSVDCKPAQLLAFAILGTAFARRFLGIASPRVALLSVGTEDEKGNRQVREALPVFKGSGLNFVGNVEGYDFFTGRADVIVCDGFVGNVVMKFAEGFGVALSAYLRRALADKVPPEVVEGLARQLWEMTNTAKKHGGPLFGVNGVALVGHGASRAPEVAGALGLARQLVELDVVAAMKDELEQFQEKLHQAVQ